MPNPRNVVYGIINGHGSLTLSDLECPTLLQDCNCCRAIDQIGRVVWSIDVMNRMPKHLKTGTDRSSLKDIFTTEKLIYILHQLLVAPHAFGEYIRYILQ